MANIEEKIERMSEKKQEKFRTLLIDVLYDRYWCRVHSVDYVNPDVQKAKEELYRQFFEKKN